jgi:Ca2+-transporting ATPase
MRGLSTADAAARLAEIGPNALPAQAPTPLWRRFVRQFQSPLIYILLGALLFEAGLWLYEGRSGWPADAAAIAVILLLNAGLGLYQEQRSEAALTRLQALGADQTWVLRDGVLRRVPSTELVPDDVARLEAGDRVPADGVLAESRGALFDESVLTGESVPVDKGDDSEVWSGTLLVRGTTLLRVTRTGAKSAMGRLASLLGGIAMTPTPLERRVDVLGRRIAAWVLTLVVVLGVAGVVAEGVSRAPEMIVFAIALAVAAVPESLPAVLTVALALGVERMARRRAVVRRLSAVEALGSVTVIATDKTGTLTENRMDVRSLEAPDVPRGLRAMALASDADLATGAGDPLELGLLRHVQSQGIDPAALRAAHSVVSSKPFDSVWKYARVTVQEDGRPVTYVKGAPEALLSRCTLAGTDRDTWAAKAEGYAREGYRVLALAWAPGETDDGWSLLGLVLLWDPPRAEVPDAVRKAQEAGVRVVMITGDHPATALAIARQIGVPGSRVVTGEDMERDGSIDKGLDEVNVFARVQPEQKLRLVHGLQSRSHIVAMTGDGVNDAPALKQSDVGVAMGQRGSDVSREVADVVLLDDNFATIVGAVEEGRGIYENIQKFLRFLFSTNLSELILVTGGAVLAFVLGLRDAGGALLLPLTAAQILWINLVTDGLPALALAFDRTPGVMQQPPRPPDSALLDPPSIRFIVGAGTVKALLAFAVIGAATWLGHDSAAARAAAFHFMAVGQLFFIYPARHTWTHPLPNRYVHAAVVLGVVIQVIAAFVPWFARLLGDAFIPPALWGVVAIATAISWAAAEGIAAVVWRRGASRPA